MGSSNSKSSENNGEIVNNIEISNTEEFQAKEQTILLLIIATVKIFEVILFLVRKYYRTMKKKINSGQQHVAQQQP